MTMGLNSGVRFPVGTLFSS